MLLRCVHLFYTHLNLISNEFPLKHRALFDHKLQVLYDEGGRKFWIHNTGPLGCLPQKLSMVNLQNKVLEGHGCISSYNDAAKMFNEGLLHLCQEMRSELKDATIVYVDIYAIKQDLIANSIKYGNKLPNCLYFELQKCFSILKTTFTSILCLSQFSSFHLLLIQ